MPSPSDTKAAPALVVDRIACTGHGICASLLTDEVTLDEWGYPVVHTSAVDPGLGDVAVPRSGPGVDRTLLTRAAY